MAVRMIEVTPEELNKAAKLIEDYAGDYQKQYRELYSSAEEMSSLWKGKDNTAYINQIRGFEDDFDKMHKLMNDYVNFLRTSAGAYKKTQENIAGDAAKLVN